MGALLAFSRAVDAVSDRFGRIADWMVLGACAVSAGNAFLRYGISASSNAWLELQWYLFAGVVMLGGAHTLFRNEHVRVDILYGWVAPRMLIAEQRMRAAQHHHAREQIPLQFEPGVR